MRNFCQTCLDGNSLLTPRCQSCPPHCLQYNADKSCQTCETGYVLENSVCEQCPSHCSSCLTSTSCQTCETGYILSASGSECILPPPPSSSPSEPKEEESGVISTVVSFAGSAICVGRSLFLTTGLISKIIQYTRYLDLIVSNELKQIYQDWNTELFSLGFPDSLSHSLNFKELPFVYARYDMDSAFLANFWSNLLVFGGGFLIFVISKALKVSLKSKEGKLYGLLRKVLAGSLNFMIVQIYGCVDDIVFYFVLDARTNRFNSHSSRVSLFLGATFGLCGGGLILFNLWIVSKYQEAKKKGSVMLEDFNKRNHDWGLLYSDFNDDNFLSHSFLAFLIARNSLASLTIATLFEYPVLQTTLLTIMDVLMIIFLLIKKPFKGLQDTISQGFFEVVALTVHICTLILSIQEGSSEKDMIRLSKIVIYLNTTLMIGTLGFMLLEISKTIRKKVKDWISKLKQKEKRKVHPVVEEEASGISEMQSLPSTTIQPIHLLTSNTITRVKPDGERSEESRQTMIKNNDMSDSGVNLLLQNSQVTFNGDNSMNQEIETSRYVVNKDLRRDEGFRGVRVGRKMLRVKRRTENEN